MTRRLRGPLLISAALLGAGVLIGIWLERTARVVPDGSGTAAEDAHPAARAADEPPALAADRARVDEPVDPFIAGVAVDRLRNAAIPSASLRVRLDRGTRSELRIADTDSEGKFRIAGLSPGAYSATFEHAEYFPFRVELTLADGRPVRDLVVGLTPGCVARGRVVPDGADPSPAVAAWLRWEPIDGAADAREVMTDAAGAFELGGLRPGRYRVEILPADLRIAWERGTVREVTVGGGDDVFELRAALGRTLSIRVFEIAGVPAGGIEVSYRLTGTGGRGVAGVLPPTDPVEGATSLHGLPDAGLLELRVAAGVRGSARLARRIESLSTEAHLLLAPGTVLSGRAVDPVGRAVRGARVVAARRGEGIQQVTGTDDDGGFQLSELTPGSWQIRVVDPASGSAALEEVEVTAAAATPSVRASLLRDSAVLGRIVGPGGGPVPGARVRLRAKDREEEAVCGTDGRFAFAARPREACRVIALRGDDEEQATSVTAVAGSFVEIALPRPR